MFKVEIKVKLKDCQEGIIKTIGTLENFTQQHNLTATEEMASLYTAGELLANSEQVGLIKVEQTMTNEGGQGKGRNKNERNTQGAVISN